MRQVRPGRSGSFRTLSSRAPSETATALRSLVEQARKPSGLYWPGCLTDQVAASRVEPRKESSNTTSQDAPDTAGVDSAAPSSSEARARRSPCCARSAGSRRTARLRWSRVPLATCSHPEPASCSRTTSAPRKRGGKRASRTVFAVSLDAGLAPGWFTPGRISRLSEVEGRRAGDVAAWSVPEPRTTNHATSASTPSTHRPARISTGARRRPGTRSAVSGTGHGSLVGAHTLVQHGQELGELGALPDDVETPRRRRLPARRKESTSSEDSAAISRSAST